MNFVLDTWKIMIVFIVFMLPEILLAQRTQAVGLHPVFDTFSMERMLAEKVSDGVSVLRIIAKTDTTFIIATGRIVSKVQRILEEPFSV